MRTDLSLDRFGWLYRLDYKKLILIVFLLRFICASAYDIFVSVTGEDILLPDAKLYSIMGRYVALLLNGYRKEDFTRDMVPNNESGQYIFRELVINKENHFPSFSNASHLYGCLIGSIYFIFGYFPLAVRVFNIFLSIGSAYLLFRIAKRRFGDFTANLFLSIALFLPTQFGYSVMLTKDMMRTFIISLILWIVYG